MATSHLLPTGPVGEVFNVIAEETGVSTSELFSLDDFVSLGIDDLLARSIVSHVMTTLKIDLPPTVFKDYPTVQGLQKYLQTITSQPAKPNRSLQPKSTKQNPPTVSLPSPTPPRKHAPKSISQTPSSVPLSILLQNRPATTARTIFLLPDGSGSGMAYARIPALSPSICLIGMNSPFLTSTSISASNPIFTLSIEALAPLWTAEIRLRQLHGPYILGGWSAGGYYSFEVAKQLMREGEVVEKLVLIDSPCRLEFEPLPPAVIAYLAAENLLGNWGKHKPPAWFVEHFAGTIEAVGRYTPTPMAFGGSMPRVYVIWSTGGVLKDLDSVATKLDLSVKVTRFLLEERRDFGLHGWDRLLPGAEVLMAKMPGNHFTMVHPPHVTELGNLLRDVVQDDSGQKDWEVIKV